MNQEMSSVDLAPLGDRHPWHRLVDEARHPAAGDAQEVGVVARAAGAPLRVRAVPPDAVDAVDPMDEPGLHQRTERPVQGDVVEPRQVWERLDVGVGEGAGQGLDTPEHREARGRAT